MVENTKGKSNSIEKLQEMIGRLSEYGMLDSYEKINKDGKDGEDGTLDYYIPYVMNDAVECYIHLKDCRLTGNRIPEFEGTATSELVFSQRGNKGLIVKQEDNVFTIWFADFSVVCEYYRYHLFAHCWRKGEDIYRRLCYIVGTIYDKYKFLGKESCNEREFQMMQLLGCKAFRYYSPIDESIDVYYDKEELERMPGDTILRQISDRLGCDSLTKEFDRYITRSGSKWNKWSQKNEEKQIERIANMLLEPENWAVYDCLLSMAYECGKDYPNRTYSQERQQEFDQKRGEVERQMHALGYEGKYPSYEKGCCYVEVLEEHPFTIEEMEYEDFTFDQHFFVSIDEAKTDKIHMGFFKGEGHRGFVVDSVDKLKEYI